MRLACAAAAFLIFCAAAAVPASAAAAPAGAVQPAGADVRGSVSDSFGDPAGGVEVTAESLSGYRETAVTDGAGAFVFRGLVQGLYRLSAGRAGYLDADAVVEVNGGPPPPVGLVLRPAAPAGAAVRVVDPQGLVMPGAVVTGSGPRGDAFEGVTGPDGLFTASGLRPGPWAFRAAVAGFEDGEAAADAAFGGAVPLTLVLGLDYAVAEDVVVLGAQRPIGRRVETRLVDAPVTTSVVGGERITTIGGTGVADALRAVPGLNVIQLSARDVQMTSRQNTASLANSQLVLLDGRSIYLDFFGTVLWDLLPVNPEAIEQMEVARGPASATWGANALTGAVHIITKPPRDSVGTIVNFSGGWIDRDAGSTLGSGLGPLFGSNVSITRAPTDRLSYRVSGGYYRSAAFPRPVGTVPGRYHPGTVPPEYRDAVPVRGDRTLDRRIRAEYPDYQNPLVVGGADYPADAQAAGPGDLSFQNIGTAQPKFNSRMDYELDDQSTLTVSGGAAGTDGILHSGLGPFAVDRGSALGYGKVNYNRGDFRAQFFTNIVNGDASNLVLPNPRTFQPLSLNFDSKTFDFDVGHSRAVGTQHFLSYGGNFRRSVFDLGIAPAAADNPRSEVGAYVEDRWFLDPFRITGGLRVDASSSLPEPFVSPRVSLMYKPHDDHSLTVSYNRAFRAPSVLEEWMDIEYFAVPFRPEQINALAGRNCDRQRYERTFCWMELFGSPAELAGELAPLGGLPIIFDAVGGRVDIGPQPRDELFPFSPESLTAYELRYAGVFDTGTAVSAAFYVNRLDNAVSTISLNTNTEGWPCRGAAGIDACNPFDRGERGAPGVA